jgi:hypothetical protein
MKSRTKDPRSSGTVAAPEGIAGVRRGRIVALDEGGQVFIGVEGAGKAAPAVLAVAIDRAALRAAMDTRQDVFVLFENGDVAKPVIVGLVPSPRAPDQASGIATRNKVLPLTVEADVDGRRVKLIAKDELVLECGKASITLRRNGRVVVRGTDVETRAEGANRIKGGQVRIN